MIVLTNDRLRVEISEPGERPNDTFRFDRAGFISEVTLDGDTHFCANEPMNLRHLSSGGRGLCCEFSGDFSSGATVGEFFPKLGVGLIKQDSDLGYQFAHKYDEVEPYPVTMKHTQTSASFVTKAVPCLGIAATIKKTIIIEENRVTLKATITNVGDKVIETEEYCHNFLSIDGMAISPDYRLELPDMPDLGQQGLEGFGGYDHNNFVADGKAIAFKQCETDVSLSVLPIPKTDKTTFTWTLLHKGAKASVTGIDEVQPTSLLLWATDHIVSPEIIQKITVAPGQSFNWKRSWIFEAEPRW
ncbi:hypothetical protein [Streptococcus marmotae]|uniref:hypothetical protein n=1 Tax=Streptococcus marmotae TaxID=1825069 RepID=UPI0008361185|nr:hypothetical protein [Streptococcus marmotae]